MARRKIFKEPDPVLLKRCREVTAFDARLWELLDDMRETMRAAEGVGLAAPQVGILRRLAIVETDGVFLEFVNPEILSTAGEVLDSEGCLSVDAGKNCQVLRPEKLTLKAFDRYGVPFEKAFEGFIVRVICHEMDHLDGVLFYTRRA